MRARRTIELGFGGLEVRIDIDDPLLTRAIEAAWAPALLARDSEDPSGGADGRTSADKLYYELSDHHLSFQGRVVETGLVCWDLLARFERHLLDEVTYRRAGSTLLHAGAVVGHFGLVVFLGASGAGKSTMARQAIEGGCSYLTDDLLMLGETVSGVARSVQFDPVRRENAPPYLLGCLVDRYFVQQKAGLRSVPLFVPPRPACLSLPGGYGPVHVCRLTRAEETSLRPLSSVELLTDLHAATLLSGRPYDGRWDNACGWELTLGSPKGAFELLEGSAQLES